MDNDHDITVFIDFVSPRFNSDALFNATNNSLGEDILAPYIYLHDWLLARGIKIHTADYLLRGEYCSRTNLYISMAPLQNYQVLARRDDVVLSAYFALECPIVEPNQYLALTEVQKYFKRIFSFSDRESLKPFLRSPIHCQHFFIPQSFESVHESIWQQNDRNFLVMMNSNKLPRLYWQELYTERLKAVEFFSHNNEIDLYGFGWDKPSFRVGKTWIPWTIKRIMFACLEQWQRIFPDPLLTAARKVYRGKSESKSATLGKYTFALCFENSILKGWITEKIFDCFFAGTIPIYWGAPDIETYIPADCFIDMRRFANYGELRDYLEALSPSDIQKYKQNARDYLRSPQFQPFTKEAFAQMFGRIIQEDTGIQIL
ncbi:hypothetical protein HCU40_21950 (plasmid) [Pseudanabaena biceps]|nr:hypothetical protein [Pseudanabaena biceps]